MIYLSGPMTGLPEFNYPAFSDACRVLRAAGYHIMSPHEVKPECDKEWTYYLRRDLQAMLQDCDSIVLLPGWESSRGAQLELYVAQALEFTIYDYIDGQLVKHG